MTTGPGGGRKTPVQVGNTIGGKVPAGWHMRTDAAKLVGRTYDTLRSWHKAGIYEPTGWMQAGRIKMWLYSDDDIAAMRKIAKSRRPGRPPNTVGG